MAVIQMQLAQTQLEVMSAIATLGSLEMDLHVQVSKQQCTENHQIVTLLCCISILQTSMSVTLSMEAVNRSVPMLLVALPAAVGQGTCWMKMDSTALVWCHASKCYYLMTFKYYMFCTSLQISMSVRVMTSTTVMRMHSALTQREVSPAPATLATLEMVSTVQVRYSMHNNIFPKYAFSVIQSTQCTCTPVHLHHAFYRYQ